MSGATRHAFQGRGETMTDTDGQDARTQIEEANHTWMEAFRHHDAAGIANLYTERATLYPSHSGPLVGTEAIRWFYQRAFDAGFTKAILEIVDLEDHGDTAIETGRFTLFLEEGLADDCKYMTVWKKNNGVWKLDRDIWTTSQPRKGT